MIKIVCTSCQKPLSLDETKLPMKEVSFPCPVCKAKLSVDRRNLENAAGSPPPAETQPPDDDDGFGQKALIVGNDNPDLRNAVKLLGFKPTFAANAQQARDYYLQEFPPVVVLNPPQITAPPLEAMQPIIGLTPADRRKSFFILVAENLRTLDGNAAFLYGVNLIVAQKDLGQLQQIYRDAIGYHERLYSPMNGVLKSMHA
ncbi:MAG TPA: hypothetical protein VJ853_07580 [Thermoanaerobaculia bacterium]|nr:hypothetical protein [Thermoanaerobaculia bacterium]